MAEETEQFIDVQPPDSSSEMKKKVVDHATEASVQAQDDPSRSSLHYGDDHDPETAKTSEIDGERGGVNLNSLSPEAAFEGEENAEISQGNGPLNRPEGSGEDLDTQTEHGDLPQSEPSPQPSVFSSRTPVQPETPITATDPIVINENGPMPRENLAFEDAGYRSPETPSDDQDQLLADAENEDPEGETETVPITEVQEESVQDTDVDAPETVRATPEVSSAPVAVEDPPEQVTPDDTDVVGSQGEPVETAPFADVNSAPSGIGLSDQSVDENADGAIVGTLNVADADADDTHSFTLSDDRFEVVGGNVKLKDGVSFDHEETDQISLDVTATDGSGAQVTESFDINIADLNEAPNAIRLDVNSDNLIKNGSFEDFDLAQGRWQGFDGDDTGAWQDANGIEIWDRLGGRQASDGDQLMELDHGSGIDSISQTVETQEGQVYDLGMDLRERVEGGTDTVEVYWNGDLVGKLDPSSSDWETFQMQVVGSGEDTLELREPANESDGYGALIDNISLVAAPSTIAENVEGAVVGTISFDDPDVGDSHSFTVSDNRFEVSDGVLRLKPDVALDHENAGQLDVEVTVTDAGGLSFSDNFSITVANVNEGPTNITLSNAETSENVEGATIGTLNVVDPDFGDTHEFVVSDDRFEVVEGTVKLKDGIALDHEDAAQIDLDVTAIDAGGAEFTQSFQIDVADINEAPTGLSISSKAVAENSQGAVVGTLDVVDVDAQDTHSFMLSDDRFEVVDGAVKLKEGVSLDTEETDQITLEVTAIDGAGAEFSQSFEIDVIDMPDVTIGTGFHASYFDVDHSLNKIDDIDWDSPPTHQELVGDINYSNSSNSFWDGGSRDTFGAKITGNIEVEEAGTFNFHIGGDDGVMLFIDGVEVVENDGLHGFRTRSGDIELEPGTHVIEVRYFENQGHAGLKVEWDGPGIDGRELLSPPDTDSLHTVNGMPVSLELDLGQFDDSEGAISHAIGGLPSGTIVQAGDHLVEVDDSGSVDISDWDTSMLFITPPIEFVGMIDAQLSTERTLSDGDVATSSTDIDIAVDAAQFDPPNIDVQSGFHASYFDVDHSLGNLDDIDWASDPTHEEVVGEINYQNGRGSFWEGGSTDTFGAKITGEVTIEEGGTYDFFVGGDDGVVLYINGEEVIDNDGLHGFRTRSGEIELEPGTHQIEVRYFENHGHAGLKLEWDGPDTNGRELVQADDDLSVAENGAFEFQIETGGSDMVTISGLPENTILISGEETVVSTGADIDLTGWDLDLVEFMPPSDFIGEIDATISTSGTAFNGEAVSSQDVFTITVGDPESADNNSGGSDDMLMASSSNDGSGSNGWSNESSTDDQDVGEQDDDAMSEPVEAGQSSEQSSENFETYERQDW